jgi:uncharacterized membrane protein
MNVNPFDIKTVLLAKHAQHVVLIHFPIALFTAGVAFDCLGQWTKSRTLPSAAYFNLLLCQSWRADSQRGNGLLRAKS